MPEFVHSDIAETLVPGTRMSSFVCLDRQRSLGEA